MDPNVADLSSNLPERSILLLLLSHLLAGFLSLEAVLEQVLGCFALGTAQVARAHALDPFRRLVVWVSYYSNVAQHAFHQIF